MSIEKKWISYGDNDLYQGYLARPQQAKGPLPVIIVYQEIWGVDEHIMDVTHRLASAGYAAFAPDLYTRGGQRQETHEQSRIESVKAFLETMPPTGWHDPDARQQALLDRPEAEQKQILDSFSALFASTSAHLYSDQIQATVHFLQDTCQLTKGQPRMSVGFCMGGSLSAYTATVDPKLAAAVFFYGSAPSDDRIANIQCPVLGFYGENDPRITGAVPDFAEKMQAAGKEFEYHVYPGAPHAFFNDTRISYQVAAARDATARMLGLFMRVL